VVSQMSVRLEHARGVPEGRRLELYRSPGGRESRGPRPDHVQPLLRHDAFDQSEEANGATVMNNGKMNKARRRERLGRRCAQLLAREWRLLGGLRDVEQEQAWNVLDGADAMDAASESAVNDVEACLGELRGAELVEIHDAFQKLSDGTYGMCAECGKRIPKARLRLVPAVSLCVACKRDRERLTESRDELPEWSGAEVLADVDKTEAFCGLARRRF